MAHELQDLLDSLRDSSDPPWNVPHVDLNGRYGVSNETPLHAFAVRGDLNACIALVEAGANVNAPGEHRLTPFHDAVHQGHLEIVDYLLQNGADPKLDSVIGTTAELAEEHPEVAALIKNFANKARLDNRR